MALNLSIPTDAYASVDYTRDTINVRDVSDVLELWAHKRTPLLNKISWGPDSGGLDLQWVHEDIGWMYVETSAAIGSAGTAFVVAANPAGKTVTDVEQAKQFGVGALLYTRAVAASGELTGDHCWMVVSTVASAATVTMAFIASAKGSVAASSKIYIVGNFANEGSDPGPDTSRARTVLSNEMTILRKDIKITGSQSATDMYAVSDELQHQTAMRMLEMQFERERSILFSFHQTRTATAAGMFAGMAELLIAQQAAAFVDATTTSLTESAFNDVVADCVDNGGSPDCVVASVAQCRKFTGWSEDRIRTTHDERLGGKFVSQYLSDTGVTLDIIPMMKFPPSFLFALDTDQIKLRAKKGRKGLLEKLGKTGDYVQYQLLSEYSLEHHGVADGYHGAFLALT
jgi:hypothetical protein